MAKKEISAELSAEFRATLEKTKLINVEVNNEVKKSFISYEVFKKICHILKRDHKDSENAIQKFTNLQYQKILNISYKSLTLFLNLILFSLVFFFYLVID